MYIYMYKNCVKRKICVLINFVFFIDLNGLGPMCFGINQRKDRSNMGHNVSCMQQPQNSNLHIPNRSLENATPTPSEVSDIITPRNGDMTPKVEPGTAPYHNGTNLLIC